MPASQNHSTNQWRQAVIELHNNKKSVPTTMPADFYQSEDLLQLETRSLFLNGWICVGRADEIPQPGDYYCLEVLDEPLVITRGNDNSISVLSNVCRHRGSVVMSGSGNTRKLTCPYHKWSYALDGKLLAAPLIEVDKTEGFDKSSCALPSFRCSLWMGYIFINMDGEAESFEDITKGVDELVKNYHMEEMRTVKAGPEHWPVNWKCLAENFMEGYHLTPVHLKTLHPMTPTRLCEKVEGKTGYTAYKSHYDEKFEGRAPYHEDMTEEERSLSMMVWIYPSFVVACSPNSAVFMGITPTSGTSLQTRWGVIAREELFDSEEAMARYTFAASFNAEDKERLISMQHGLESRYATRSPLAPPDYEGTIWDFYHYVADKLTPGLKQS